MWLRSLIQTCFISFPFLDGALLQIVLNSILLFCVYDKKEAQLERNIGIIIIMMQDESKKMSESTSYNDIKNSSFDQGTVHYSGSDKPEDADDIFIARIVIARIYLL